MKLQLLPELHKFLKPTLVIRVLFSLFDVIHYNNSTVMNEDKWCH
jgi:hypothetical protein